MTSMKHVHCATCKHVHMYPLVSFLELIPRIFEIKGVTSFRSEKLLQDPLENFFGCQRQRGKSHSSQVL